MEMYILIFGTSTILLTGGMLVTNFVIMRNVQRVRGKMDEEWSRFKEKVKTLLED